MALILWTRPRLPKKLNTARCTGAWQTVTVNCSGNNRSSKCYVIVTRSFESFSHGLHYRLHLGPHGLQPIPVSNVKSCVWCNDHVYINEVIVMSLTFELNWYRWHDWLCVSLGVLSSDAQSKDSWSIHLGRTSDHWVDKPKPWIKERCGDWPKISKSSNWDDVAMCFDDLVS